jgi:hypothetical protein
MEHETLRNLMYAAIERLAKALQAGEPALSREEAIAKAVKTPEGLGLYEIYRLPEANLPLREASARMKARAELAKAGLRSFGDAVAQLAKVLGGGDVSKGLVEVRKAAPGLYHCYLAERGHPGL